MKTLSVAGWEKTSRIHIGESVKRLPAYLPASRIIVITDENVAGHYRHLFPGTDVIAVGRGEAAKTLETVAEIFDRLVACEADRSVFLLGFGGGIVLDITGFAAATYLRGVRFAYCPTTLLSQVDASVGGKTGVNFRGYKNMVGVFNQPEFVICDPEVLNTLPQREISCGFAEVVKHAAIADTAYFDFLEQQSRRAFSLEPQVMERVVYDSVAIKAAVVSRDEKERGERRKLNFGHTFGHAVEKHTGMAHGEAVSIGMMLAARISERRGMLPAADVDRLERLLLAFHLPAAVDLEKAGIMDAVSRDKKRAGEAIHFVLLEALGRAVVRALPISELTDILSDL